VTCRLVVHDVLFTIRLCLICVVAPVQPHISGLIHLPAFECIMDGRIDIITCYFEMGLCQRDILFALAVNNGIVMSITTLKRIMQTARLYRRKNYSDATEIVLFVQKQVEKHGGLFGYRWMHTKCLENGLTVSRSEIAMIMQTIDPEGIALRRQRRLRRREYFAKGPNFVWHIDGWDKLKPYGVAVHGCVDGFSRHIIWLEAHWTNNQPRLIGGYYIKAVARLGGCPRIVRADNGTENGHVCAIQQYLRRNDRDSFAGEKSFLYGRSTANQRIEFLWGMLRKQCMQTWMDLFTTLSDDGHFCGDELDKALVQFCFMDIIQVMFVFSVISRLHVYISGLLVNVLLL